MNQSIKITISYLKFEISRKTQPIFDYTNFYSLYFIKLFQVLNDILFSKLESYLSDSHQKLVFITFCKPRDTETNTQGVMQLIKAPGSTHGLLTSDNQSIMLTQGLLGVNGGKMQLYV